MEKIAKQYLISVTIISVFIYEENKSTKSDERFCRKHAKQKIFLVKRKRLKQYFAPVLRSQMCSSRNANVCACISVIRWQINASYISIVAQCLIREISRSSFDSPQSSRNEMKRQNF